MRSLQWRMLAALGLVIVLAWSISIAMFAAVLVSGRANFWHEHLDWLGQALVGSLPDHWKPEAPPHALPNAAQLPGRGGDPSGILTAMLLNTVELAIVGLLMWWAVVASLRPLKAISAEIGRRRAFDAAPLPTERVPSELRPLLVAFNALLGRVDTAMKAEHQFIADAAHELRTPLAALHVQADVALLAGTLERKDEALRKLLDIAQRSHRLAEQLLDLARLDAGLHALSVQRIDLLELANHVVDEFVVRAEGRGTRLSIDGTSCWVRCDVDEMGILIRNLIDNALRHGRADGAVEVSCSQVVREDGTHPVLEVVDDGPGVPESERVVIFERFYRAKGSVVRGSGIGLSLVVRIAELHEASIETGAGMGGAGLCVRVVFPPQD
ncbi:ATP-binding protein [Dyella sp. 2RAB6]|uniref:ATP-binding protein n=1 Tax=Dyella sp. 2RAB6 TaxID=3232992 RepID=UPI003F91072F